MVVGVGKEGRGSSMRKKGNSTDESWIEMSSFVGDILFNTMSGSEIAYAFGDVGFGCLIPARE